MTLPRPGSLAFRWLGVAGDDTYLASIIGITRAEVRDWYHIPWMDGYALREWNGRLHVVLGLEVHNGRRIAHDVTISRAQYRRLSSHQSHRASTVRSR